MREKSPASDAAHLRRHHGGQQLGRHRPADRGDRLVAETGPDSAEGPPRARSDPPEPPKRPARRRGAGNGPRDYEHLGPRPHADCCQRRREGQLPDPKGGVAADQDSEPAESERGTVDDQADGLAHADDDHGERHGGPLQRSKGRHEQEQRDETHHGHSRGNRPGDECRRGQHGPLGLDARQPHDHRGHDRLAGNQCDEDRDRGDAGRLPDVVRGIGPGTDEPVEVAGGRRGRLHDEQAERAAEQRHASPPTGAGFHGLPGSRLGKSLKIAICGLEYTRRIHLAASSRS